MCVCASYTLLLLHFPGPHQSLQRVHVQAGQSLGLGRFSCSLRGEVRGTPAVVGSHCVLHTHTWPERRENLLSLYVCVFVLTLGIIGAENWCLLCEGEKAFRRRRRRCLCLFALEIFFFVVFQRLAATGWPKNAIWVLSGRAFILLTWVTVNAASSVCNCLFWDGLLHDERLSLGP